jgi:hypothetical protein
MNKNRPRAPLSRRPTRRRGKLLLTASGWFSAVKAKKVITVMGILVILAVGVAFGLGIGVILGYVLGERAALRKYNQRGFPVSPANPIDRTGA